MAAEKRPNPYKRAAIPRARPVFNPVDLGFSASGTTSASGRESSSSSSSSEKNRWNPTHLKSLDSTVNESRPLSPGDNRDKDTLPTEPLLTANTTASFKTSPSAAEVIPEASSLAATARVMMMPGFRSMSQHLTFGSAEILTVAECAQQAARYVNQSVRLTGLVQYVYVHPTEKATVSLLLVDPLSSGPSSSGRRGAVVSGPDAARPQVPTTPAAAPPPQQRTLGPRKRLTSSLSKSQLPKKPLLPTTTVSTTTTSNTTTATTSQKTKPTDGWEALVQTWKERGRVDCVWVRAHPDHVQVQPSARVGTLVMVMGEIYRASSETTADSSWAAASGPDLTDLLVQATDLASHQDASVNDANCHQDNSYYFYLQARILRCAEGTNMSRYTQALQARRRYLQEQQQYLQQITTMAAPSILSDPPGSKSDPPPIPGWGPYLRPIS